MPNWTEVLFEIQAHPSSLDFVRRKYLKQLHHKVNRNIIAYYSGWLQKPGIEGVQVEDNDKNGFMTTIHKLDRTKGLDLILHTPGGSIAATESIVDYLRYMFGDDIRAVVPQLAMSAGTMIACSCKQILMGLQSNLGPIDPQFKGIPVSGVLEEFNQAIKETKEDPGKIPMWKAIIEKYHPTFLGECVKAIKWSDEIVTHWLLTNMFQEDDDKEDKVQKIVTQLSDHSEHKSHERHISIDACEALGLKIMGLRFLVWRLKYLKML